MPGPAPGLPLQGVEPGPGPGEEAGQRLRVVSHPPEDGPHSLAEVGRLGLGTCGADSEEVLVRLGDPAVQVWYEGVGEGRDDEGPVGRMEHIDCNGRLQ